MKNVPTYAIQPNAGAAAAERESTSRTLKTWATPKVISAVEVAEETETGGLNASDGGGNLS
jgi:hypothetical protein